MKPQDSLLQVTIESELCGFRLNGVGRYTIEIVSHADTESPGMDLRVLHRGQEIPVSEWLANGLATGHSPNLPRRLWQIRRRMTRRRSKSRVIHYPSGHLPGDWAKGLSRKVITLHGAVRMSGAKWVSPRLKKSGELLKRRLQKNPDELARVITVSEFSRGEVIRAFDLNPEQVVVIPNGVDLCHFRPLAAGEAGTWIKEAFGIQQPYLLHVGPCSPRKNVLCLVQAFGRLKGRSSLPHKLVLAGGAGTLSAAVREEIARLALADHIIFTGRVSDEALVKLYNAASVFVFPSLNEGFGFPVLEAMACGTPVVTSKCTALPETAGEAAALVEDPASAENLAGVIRRVLEDSTLQTDLRTMGMDRVKNFTWKRCATAHLELYRQVVEE